MAAAESPRVTLEPLHCVTCGSLGPFEPTLEILLRCPRCGLVFADPGRSYDDIRALYGEAYFRGEEYADYLGDKQAIQRSFRDKVALVARTAPDAQRLFEVGAAYGFFLELARARWEVAGIDVAPEAVAYARDGLGLNVQLGDFLTAQVPHAYYDLFCMWDTIEHLARPDAYLERVAELIAPGGYLFISTGDISSPVAQRQGRSWRLIHPPTHLFYFSRVTLSRLLQRYGFEVVSCEAMGMHRTLRQTVFSLLVQRRPSLRPFYERLASLPLARWSYYLNLGDIMVIAARATEHTSALKPTPKEQLSLLLGPC